MTLASGIRLGAYEILSLLGAGGMGEVYRALDHRLGREVAIKVLPAPLASDPDRLARFEREARTVAALNHPNIVTLFSVEDVDRVRFLTMEVVEGSTLQSLVTPGGLPLPRLLDLAIPLTNALIAAHASGVAHRDLKPGNVMVTRDGRVKVLDFGLAKITPAQPTGPHDVTNTVSLALSNENRVMGTPSYMAPEQLRGEPTDERTDLFALGVILYELAAGQRPFEGATSATVASAILRDAAPSLADLRPDYPASFGRLVSRCLEKSPSARFQTAAAVHEALLEIERGSGEKEAPSIAVLPFANMSADPENEFFSDGLTEELLNVLAKIPDLKVTGRTSCFAFKGKLEDLRHIGRKLGVSTLLEGSVRKAGNRVRITAQLVQASNGFHLWSETYDRVLDDIFAVQDDIARAVATVLQFKLLGSKRAGPRSRGPGYELTLRAKYFFQQLTSPGLAKAVELYQQAVDEDPKSAVAWAGLAHAHALQAAYGYGPAKECQDAARTEARRAVSLDRGLAEGHAVMGYVLGVFDFRWDVAISETQLALAISPGSSDPMMTMSQYLGIMGRIGEALELAVQVQDIDPLNATVHSNRARIEGLASNLEESRRAYLRALELSPDMTSGHGSLGIVYLRLGRSEEALAEIQKETSEGFREHFLAIAYHVMGKREESDAALERLLEWKEHWACQVAGAHAVRGEANEAFHWLDRAIEMHDPGIPFVPRHWIFQNLRSDARWPRLLQKIGLAC